VSPRSAPSGRRARAARAAAFALALAGGVASASAADFAFVHVEANVGGASGGHVALRIDERAWHLRVAADGLLRLERQAWDDFTFRYAVLGNRPLHVARVDVPEPAARRVEEALTTRWVMEIERDDAVADRALDLRLVEALSGEAAGVPVRAAGLLDPRGRDGIGAPALRRRAADALGPGGLDAALARGEAALSRGPGAGEGALRVYREELARVAALRAIRDGHPLAEEARVDPWRAGARVGLRLDAPGRRALAARAEALAEDVAELLVSPRPDRGTALLVVVARHRAAARSLAESRLHLVDPLPEGPLAIDAAAAGRRRAELGAVAAELGVRTDALWREAVADGHLDDAEARALEGVAGRAVEAARAVSERRGVRVAPEHAAPSRAREMTPPPAARPGEDALAALRADAEARWRRAREAQASGREYQIVLHNCATELVRATQEALGGPEAAARALGGRLAPGEDGSFIPFVLQRQVRERFRLAAESGVPSLRSRRLAALYAEGPDALVYLRESNVLTSTLYAPRDRDGTFLLFTDDVLWPRPLYGLVNLGAGLLDGVVGLATGPFDGGRRLARAGRGVLFSLPELVFFNVRKGSYDAASLPEEERVAAAP
jgi:hypothetical protein